MQQNMGKMLKSLGAMQKKMDAVQQELGDAVFDGSAASGLVKVKMTGKGELKSVTLDPSILSEDAETVGDLVVVATRNAFEAKELVAKQKLATISSGLLPFGMKLPGLGA